MEEGIWRVQRGRKGTALFGETGVEEGIWKIWAYIDEIIKTDFQEIERSEAIDWTSLAEWSTDGLL